MQGQSLVLPAPSGEDDGQIMPADKESLMYFSMVSLSNLDKLYNRLEGRVAQDSKPMS